MHIEIAVPLQALQNLSNFWGTLEMLFINYELDLIPNGSANCVTTNLIGAGTFTATDTKLYVPVVTLSTQDNVKLLLQLKSRLKRTINWNKYQISKISLQEQN